VSLAKPFRAAALAAASCAALLAGCSAKTDPQPTGNVTVAFPSVAAAAANDTIELLVFDASDPSTCLDVVEKRRTGQALPKPLLDVPAVATCSFAPGKPVDVGFGKRAFLVIGQRGGKDFLVGCMVQGIGDAPVTVTIPVTLVSNTVAVPETTCVQLSDHCQDRCPK